LKNAVPKDSVSEIVMTWCAEGEKEAYIESEKEEYFHSEQDISC
jgi:hypothetical protein